MTPQEQFLQAKTDKIIQLLKSNQLKKAVAAVRLFMSPTELKGILAKIPADKQALFVQAYYAFELSVENTNLALGIGRSGTQNSTELFNQFYAVQQDALCPRAKQIVEERYKDAVKLASNQETLDGDYARLAEQTIDEVLTVETIQHDANTIHTRLSMQKAIIEKRFDELAQVSGGDKKGRDYAEPEKSQRKAIMLIGQQMVTRHVGPYLNALQNQQADESMKNAIRANFVTPFTKGTGNYTKISDPHKQAFTEAYAQIPCAMMPDQLDLPALEQQFSIGCPLAAYSQTTALEKMGVNFIPDDTDDADIRQLMEDFEAIYLQLYVTLNAPADAIIQGLQKIVKTGELSSKDISEKLNTAFRIDHPLALLCELRQISLTHRPTKVNDAEEQDLLKRGVKLFGDLSRSTTMIEVHRFLIKDCECLSILDEKKLGQLSTEECQALNLQLTDIAPKLTTLLASAKAEQRTRQLQSAARLDHTFIAR